MKINFRGMTVEVPQLERIADRLTKIEKMGEKIMATLEEVKVMVENANQKIDALNVAYDGYRALVASIQAELEALKTTSHLNPVVQTKVDEIASLIGTTVAKIDETYNENFPGGPGEPPPDEV